MRYVLDTTYLLPAIGIAVKRVPTEEVVESWNRGFESAISEITIFELAAKGAKYVSAGKLEARRVSNGIEAVRNDESLIKLPTYDSYEQLSTAIKLRGILGDFIDCLILATAMSHADGLLTEDGLIHDLKRDERFIEILKPMNLKFEIRHLSDDLS